MIYATSDLHVYPKLDNASKYFGYWDSQSIIKLFENWQKQVKTEDLIIIVGDVIDCKDVITWRLTINSLFKELIGTILIIPGNHDNNRKGGILGGMQVRSPEGSWRVLRGPSLRWDEHLIVGGCGMTKPSQEASPRRQEVWQKYQRSLERKLKEASTRKLKPLFATHFPLVTSNHDPIAALQSKGIKHLLGRPSGAIFEAPILLSGHLHGEAAKSYQEFTRGLRPTYRIEICSVDANEFKLVKVG